MKRFLCWIRLHGPSIIDSNGRKWCEWCRKPVDW